MGGQEAERGREDVRTRKKVSKQAEISGASQTGAPSPNLRPPAAPAEAGIRRGGPTRQINISSSSSSSSRHGSSFIFRSLLDADGGGNGGVLRKPHEAPAARLPLFPATECFTSLFISMVFFLSTWNCVQHPDLIICS